MRAKKKKIRAEEEKEEGGARACKGGSRGRARGEVNLSFFLGPPFYPVSTARKYAQ